MNTLLKTSLLCYLAVGTNVVVARALEQPLAMAGESSATLQTLPAVDVILGRQEDAAQKFSTIEGLWPFFYEEQQLLFLQGGWHRQQQRNLLSLGLGWRYFPKVHWGLGFNLFYDQETKRQQRRLGLGGEAWWQSLTLAVNGYLPVNGWKSAHELTGYRQRTASGYDATLRGYLPALPHLGVSLRTVRYWGDEVALDSEQQRHRNPQQWGWGVSYTPVPLLTLAYQRQAGCGNAKHQISAVLSYRFSLPLSQQLDPQQVFVLHSAEGQRLARVQRERMIVVKYAKIADPAEEALKEAEALEAAAVRKLKEAEAEVARARNAVAVAKKEEEEAVKTLTERVRKALTEAEIKALTEAERKTREAAEKDLGQAEAARDAARAVVEQAVNAVKKLEQLRKR
ncbi:inverse autotransporter beta domain-containing protein [unidentified bacterial endosymbiont]|uniref:inverse autotransporter beta domain-containing protein n=1 Tax=unidentified bacterial endosymbiont TaxID=2355 RepID=UPI0020A03D07|nr:inverse autotransporter beta domain-containing protein [unidentified bacterial endosymbiont]